MLRADTDSRVGEAEKAEPQIDTSTALRWRLEKAILNEAETADLLGVEPRTVRLWRATRGLPHYKITAKVVRFKTAEVLAWMERSRRARI